MIDFLTSILCGAGLVIGVSVLLELYARWRARR